MSHIFISYAREDRSKALEIYQALIKNGFEVWIDVKNLIPGQQWKREIEIAIQNADFFIACLSENSVTKKGFIQAELKQAIDVTKTIPFGGRYIIPVRLSNCVVPYELSVWQWIDYFEEDGEELLVNSLSAKKGKASEAQEASGDQSFASNKQQQETAQNHDTDLTQKEKIIREERTALLINLAGVNVQKTLSAVDQGVSTRKFYKILANVIWDWHWLSFRNPQKYEFNGIGDLVWIPHKLGALGQVAPKIEYDDIKLYQGYFANLIELFTLDTYSKYGLRAITSREDQRYLLFGVYIPYDNLAKSYIEAQEQHFWAELVKIYSTLSDEALYALASCRTATSSVHNLWIQFVMWKHYIGHVFDILQDQPSDSLDPAQIKVINENIDAANTCIKQIPLLIEYRKNIQTYIGMFQEISSQSEFSLITPCTDELTPSLSNKLKTFLELSDSLVALHDICYRELQQTDLKRLSVHFLSLLMETSFNEFEQKVDLKFESPNLHYKNFLEKNYPLPTSHFLKGN